MTNKQPPFEINERIMADVIEIAELVGRVSVTDKISMNPTLRRTNRIQTIYSSLAIEQNTLDIEQVTAVYRANVLLHRQRILRKYRMLMKFMIIWIS